MSYDELELDRMGDRRTATFFCISDTDSTYNFLVALAFSQMFNLLCERADNVHGGRLSLYVRVLSVCILIVAFPSQFSEISLIVLASRPPRNTTLSMLPRIVSACLS